MLQFIYEIVVLAINFCSIMFTDMDKVIISTGNILSVNKKAGQKAEDEVIRLQQFIKHLSDDFEKCLLN